MQDIPEGSVAIAAPELTALGKRLELLRIERGLSKQVLARQAATSRQQLWRVMTGKSELTSSLRLRLAEALHVDATALTASSATLSATFPLWPESAVPKPVASISLDDYVSSVAAIERTLATFPDGASGWKLKRLFLNCLEEVAADAGIKLPAEYFALRARVTNREGPTEPGCSNRGH
jgi:transcriptional regulator with XRE-family HTH domain